MSCSKTAAVAECDKCQSPCVHWACFHSEHLQMSLVLMEPLGITMPASWHGICHPGAAPCSSHKSQQHHECTHKPEANFMAHVQIHFTPSGTQSDNCQVLECAEAARHLDLLFWLFSLSLHCSGGSNTRQEIKRKTLESKERCSICLTQWYRGLLHTCENLLQKKYICNRVRSSNLPDWATLTQLDFQIRRCSSSDPATHTPAAPKHNTEVQQPLECHCRTNDHRQHNHQYYYFSKEIS